MTATGTASPAPHGSARRADVRFLLAVNVIVALAVAVAVLAMPAVSAGSGAPSEYVSADTTRQRVRTDAGTQVWESSVLTGAELVGTGPWWLSLATEDFGQLVESRWLRVSVTTENAGTSGQALYLYRITPEGLRLATVSDDTSLHFFYPGLLIVPADGNTDASWTDEGTVHTFGAVESVEAPYEATSSPSPDQPSGQSELCVSIETTIETSPEITLAPTTWCPSRGVVPDGEPVSAEPFSARDLTDADADRRDPAAWQVSAVARDLTAPQSWGAAPSPVATGEVLVIPQTPSADLIFVPGDHPDQAWRAHPGGEVTDLQRYGSLVVAATSEAHLVSYDTAGTWQWTVSVPDIVTRPAARSGDALRVVDESAGLSAVELTTGELLWRTALPDPIVSDPVACGALTYVGTTANQVVAVDAGGVVAWQAELAHRPTLLTCAPDGIVAVSAATLDAVSAQGEWTSSVPSRDGSISSVSLVGGTLVTSSVTQVTGYDPDGLTQRWRRELYCPTTIAVEEGLWCARDTEADLLDETGEAQASWQFAAPTDPHAPWAVTPDGLVRYDGPFSLTRVQ